MITFHMAYFWSMAEMLQCRIKLISTSCYRVYVR